MDAKSHLPIVTLSTKDNVNLTKQLSDGFKRSIYWNSYQTIPAKVLNQGTNIYELLSVSFQGVKGLFVLDYFIAAPFAPGVVDNETGIKDNRKYFLPRWEIKTYNVSIDDQPINDLIKKYYKVRKVSTGQGDDYTIGSLLDYAYFKDNYRPIAVNLSKQKDLVADPRAIQQTLFQRVSWGAANTKIGLYNILEKSKETILELYKGTTKIMWIV